MAECRLDHLQPTLTNQLDCAERNKCTGKSCNNCDGACLCDNFWIIEAGGANYLDLSFVDDVLPEIIQRHLQFKDDITQRAVQIISETAKKKTDTSQDNIVFVGVHVRRTDFHEYSKFWMPQLLNETFFEAAMDHFRSKYYSSSVAFLVLSDDQEWCKQHLRASDVYHVSTPDPEVDMAIMANCNASIIDYGTFGMWGAILAGGETVTSRETFRDVRWAADHFGWTYV